MQGNNVLYAGVGLWQSSSNEQAQQQAAVVALDPSTGEVLWTKVLGMVHFAGKYLHAI